MKALADKGIAAVNQGLAAQRSVDGVGRDSQYGAHRSGAFVRILFFQSPNEPTDGMTPFLRILTSCIGLTSMRLNPAGDTRRE
jgi:hypothetical protein